MDNNNLNQANGNIGTDPTILPVIEMLDVPESSAPNPEQNPKKKGSGLKKVLFVVLILALMGAVAFGVYYYLSLGNSKKTTPAPTPAPPQFQLKDIEVNLNSELSTSILDYGDFSNLDISGCSLNTDDVDVTKAGDYDYYMVCDNTKYTAKITVVNNVIFSYKTNLIQKPTASTVLASDFITSKASYDYSFESEEEVKNYLKGAAGLYKIDILIKDANDNETTSFGLLHILSKRPKMTLTCTKTEEEDSTSITSIIKVPFNENQLDMNNRLSIVEYKYNEEAAYNIIKNTIADGKITLDDETGYALIDDEVNTISIVRTLEQEELDTEYGSSFPTAYSDIRNYFKDTKGYSCKI